MISQIVACSNKNFGIGIHNDLPWNFNREDMKLFRTLTMGNTVVMGRKTFESLPVRQKYKDNPDLGFTRCLKNRNNIVVSRKYEDENKLCYINKGAYWTSDINRLLLSDNPVITDNVYIIGGAQIYQETIDVVDRIYLSQMVMEYTCDVFYPQEVLEDFYLLDSIQHSTFKLKIFQRKR